MVKLVNGKAVNQLGRKKMLKNVKTGRAENDPNGKMVKKTSAPEWLYW